MVRLQSQEAQYTICMFIKVRAEGIKTISTNDSYQGAAAGLLNQQYPNLH